MKFNNKFDLVEYLQVVTEIVQDYFDLNTHEYMPHIGEINSVCVYYNHCVEPEDYDELPHPITDIHDMEKLFNNVEFMAHYRSEVNDYIDEFGLTFGAAYDKAMDIVEYKKTDANSFAYVITSGLNAALESFTDALGNINLENLTGIAKDISSGKLSNESIAEAYSHSDRFKSNTEDLNEQADKIVSVLKEKQPKE